MKKKLVLLFAAVFCLSGMLVPAVKVVEISIGGYDRPYYVHGPGYWNGRTYYGWAQDIGDGAITIDTGVTATTTRETGIAVNSGLKKSIPLNVRIGKSGSDLHSTFHPR